VEGAELGSCRIRFTPGQVLGGEYRFAIGSAGSTTLVCQTVLPLLLMAEQPSKVTFEGGTHNGLSPSLTFLQHAYLPVLAAMGVQSRVEVTSLGFNPVGGGKWSIEIAPAAELKPFSLVEPPVPGNCKVTGIVSNLSAEIVDREYNQVVRGLGWTDAPLNKQIVDSPGPGNAIILHAEGTVHDSISENVGEMRVTAENVAKRAANRMKKFLRSGAAVEGYLADQLLVPMVLVGQCRFTTIKPSQHTLTNIEVIEQLTEVRFSVNQLDQNLWEIESN
jgi:RNA 3'-terminal phosphate cyclase (ATP)